MVALEKLRPTTSMSGRALNAENKVMVLPEPKTLMLMQYCIAEKLKPCFASKVLKRRILTEKFVLVLEKFFSQCCNSSILAGQ